MADAAITDINDGELLSILTDSKQELFNLRFQLATGQLENTARIRQVKKKLLEPRPKSAAVKLLQLRLLKRHTVEYKEKRSERQPSDNRNRCGTNRRRRR